MALRLSIVNDRIAEHIKSSGDAADIAFLKFANSALRNCEYDDLQPEDIVDGGEDKQLDILSVEEDISEGTADIWIIQAKNSPSFSSSALTLLGNGLTWIFQKPLSQYSRLANLKLRRQIEVVREIRNRCGPSNMRIHVFFVTKGDTDRLSKEFKEEASEIREKYTAAALGSFELEILGASELVDILALRERSDARIDDSLPIVYDRNRPSYIRYSSAGITGYICTVRGLEVARLVSGGREKSIFDLNLRRFYGAEKGKVNPTIAETASSKLDSTKFWFFNNGVTIVCDKVQVVDDPDKAHLKLTNVQVVNGCQTSMTLAATAAKGVLLESVEVLVKVYETRDEAFVSRVVLTTNNQNSINSRDLKANDQVQEDYQRGFKQLYGLYYERKPREFRGLPREAARSVVSNERIAQAYLAIVKKRPTIARTQKYKIWEDEFYRQIFVPTTLEKHLLAYSIYAFCLKMKKEALIKFQSDSIRYSIVSYGVFHLARAVGFVFTQKENWDDPEETSRFVEEIGVSNIRLKRCYFKSVSLIRSLIAKRSEWKANINNVFKANEIESVINKAL